MRKFNSHILLMLQYSSLLIVNLIGEDGKTLNSHSSEQGVRCLVCYSLFIVEFESSAIRIYRYTIFMFLV